MFKNLFFSSQSTTRAVIATGCGNSTLFAIPEGGASCVTRGFAVHTRRANCQTAPRYLVLICLISKGSFSLALIIVVDFLKIIDTSGTPVEIKELEPRWRVAAAFGVLFHDIGKLVSDYSLTDEDCGYQWNPFKRQIAPTTCLSSF